MPDVMSPLHGNLPKLRERHETSRGTPAKIWLKPFENMLITQANEGGQHSS